MFDLIRQGGPVMLPILLISIGAIGLIIERAIAFARVREKKADIGAWVIERMEKGGTSELASELAESPSPESQVLLEGLRCRNLPATEREARMQARALREIGRLEKNVPWLQSIANIETLLGLLGTVIGMIRSFVSLRLSGVADPAVLAGGIAEALITTAAGLLVAIPSLDRLPRVHPDHQPHDLPRGERRHRFPVVPRPAEGDGVKLPRKWRDDGILLTPLIDMVFLTLIFFMVNATLSINPAIRVDLPRARTSLGALSEEIVVSVRTDGSLYIGERRVTPDGLRHGAAPRDGPGGQAQHPPAGGPRDHLRDPRGGDGPGQAGRRGPHLPGDREEAFAVNATLRRGMPWAVALLLHAAVLLIPVRLGVISRARPEERRIDLVFDQPAPRTASPATRLPAREEVELPAGAAPVAPLSPAAAQLPRAISGSAASLDDRLVELSTTGSSRYPSPRDVLADLPVAAPPADIGRIHGQQPRTRPSRRSPRPRRRSRGRESREAASAG